MSNNESARKLSALSVLNIEQVGCSKKNNEASTKAIKGSTKGEERRPEQGKVWEVGCSNKATRKKQTYVDCEVCSFEHNVSNIL